MAESKDSSENLSIRCPKCKQRFSVEGNLMDRMVECGACDTRFRINDEVILRTKKFYPGERGGKQLNRFQRVPLSAAIPEGLATMRYAEFSHPEQLEPASPQRILAGIMGVSLMVIIALMLIFAVNPGGAFSVMPLMNKLTIAGFASILGIAMLIYANPKARLKAATFGLLLAAGVVSLPFFFTGQPIAKNNTGDSKPVAADTALPEGDADPLTGLRERFITKPLEAEQERLTEAGSDKKAYGIYLTGLNPRNKYLVRDFLIRDTQAGPSSHPYPRDGGDYLMVLTEVPLAFVEVAEIAGRLGQKQEIHEDIGVVVVQVDNSHFAEGSAEKLNTKTDPAFYELNQSELGNIDLDRVKSAVERLADAEPTIYRADISRMMIELLGKPGVTFHDSLAKALLVWAEEPEAAAEVGLEALKKSVAAGDRISEHLVDLVTRAKSDDAIPTLNLLWVKDPVTWEEYYGRFGPTIVPGLMGQLDSESAPLRRSAIRLLGQVGTDVALPALEKLTGDQDPEVRILAERAGASIKQR
jgi:hypothetical protein